MMRSMGVGSGEPALLLNLRIKEAKRKAEQEQHDRAREVVKDEKDKAAAQRADRRIVQKDIDQWRENERKASAETDALLKRDKAFAQDREEPAYRIAIHELNVFDPDFPSHLSAVNARYPNISVTDKGQLIASIKMADAGMKFGPHGIEYIPGKLQDKYRKAEEALGFHELRDLATYSRSTGKFLEIDAFEVEQKVLEKRVELARRIAQPGESVRVGTGGEIAFTKIAPPTVDPAKEAAKEVSAQAKTAASNKRFVTERRIRQNDNELHSLQRKLHALELFKDAEDEAEIKAHSDRIKELTADNDRLLREMETPDSPPPPTEQKKPPGAPPATTSTPAPAAPATPATGAGTSPVPAETPTAPASKTPVKSAPAAVETTTPAAKKERIPFKDRMKESVSQTQASAAPDMNALTASARDFSSFSGRREEIESNPDLSAEFNAAAESMSQMLQSLGYDAAASAASGGYVADGSTIEFEQDEYGEPVAVTVDPDGARTPLKKAASEATASIGSPITAS